MRQQRKYCTYFFKKRLELMHIQWYKKILKTEQRKKWQTLLAINNNNNKKSVTKKLESKRKHMRSMKRENPFFFNLKQFSTQGWHCGMVNEAAAFYASIHTYTASYSSCTTSNPVPCKQPKKKCQNTFNCLGPWRPDEFPALGTDLAQSWPTLTLKQINL